VRIETGKSHGSKMKRMRCVGGGERLRCVVVTATEAMFCPLEVVTELGFTVQVAARAGTVQERLTGEENPKNGVMAMSLIYWAVRPAVTVWDVIPLSDTAKSATRFRATAVELDAV
jgi:hypothetical protein